VALYGPGTDSGTFDFFTEAINGESGKIRTDYTDIGEDDNAAVTAVSGTRGAMGYIPYSYFTEAGDQVKALAIDGGDGCVDATLENVLDGSYTPLGRPLFTYASDTALARRGARLHGVLDRELGGDREHRRLRPDDRRADRRAERQDRPARRPVMPSIPPGHVPS
jgi:hypothetical protein